MVACSIDAWTQKGEQGTQTPGPWNTSSKIAHDISVQIHFTLKTKGASGPSPPFLVSRTSQFNTLVFHVHCTANPSNCGVVLSTNTCTTFRATSQLYWHPTLPNCKLDRIQQLSKVLAQYELTGCPFSQLLAKDF